MNAPTAAPNGATSLALEAQSLIQSHADKIELFRISKIGRYIQLWGIKETLSHSK